MAGEVGEVGKGFFNETGKLKTSDQIAKESEAQRTSKPTNVLKSTDSAQADIKSEAKAAFTAVRTRFNEQANQAISLVNENDKALEEAEEVVKAQLETAKDLKEAIKAEDTQRADQARTKLAELEKQRKALSQEVEDRNNETRGDRSKTISLGNEQKASIKIDEVKFEESSEADFSSTQGVNAFIDELQADRESINTQQSSSRQTRDEIKEVVSDTRTELRQIEEDTLRSIEDAEKSANKIADQIRSGGQQVALSTISKNVNEVAVKSLLG